MGTSNDSIIRSIQYNQERLDRYALNKNEDKMLYVIKKLNKLPINTAHLENTGVGRTVNALKKHEGKVGEAAKELVASWKDMVLREEKAAQEAERAAANEEDVDSVYSSDHEAGNHSSEENYGHGSDHLNSSPRKDQSNDSDEEHVNSDSKKQYNSDASEICSETEPEVERYSAPSPKEEKKSSKKRHHSTDRAEDEKDAKHKSKKAKRDHHRNEDKYKSEPKARTSREHESGNKIVNKYDKIEKHESKSKSHESKSRDESSRSKSKSEKRKKEGGDDGEERRSQQRSDKKEAHVSKSHASSEKHDKHSRREKDDSSNKKDSSKKTEKKHKSHRHEKDSPAKKASDHEESLSDSKHTSSREKGKKEKSPKKPKETKSVDKEKIVNGIGSESGASFAEALGMCGPKTIISSVKKKHASSSSSDKPRSSSSLETDQSAASSSSQKNRTSSSNSRPEPVQQETVPELLREKELEPLNINISSLLPEITPNYRPLGVSLDLQPKRTMTDDEALSRVMSNRNQRTKVYSGNKSFGKVESLFQICVRILQDNIDALEYTGGVPYSILKPILERATPDQLFNMEHHNPYLIEDTDELWLLHCQKQFRTKARDELESWRDMYMRCLDEREARLNAITANIKQSQDKSMPIRTTKLAYVDSVVKPPRNIARQQVKNGIFDKKTISTTAKLTAIAKSGEAGKISVPNPGSRGGERSSSAAAVKPKKAPLMAKTLSFLKNRFKR